MANEQAPDNNDLVEIENITNETITIWWGANIYMVRPGPGSKIPRIVARGSITHESYRGLRIVGDEQANTTAPEGAKASETKDQGTKDAEVVLVKPWSNPEWNPLECEQSEIDDYINTFHLKIAENTPGTTQRTIVDEHFIDSLG